jgi:FLVCR family feline leukemia virus subgroup C receptor-related protein
MSLLSINMEPARSTRIDIPDFAAKSDVPAAAAPPSTRIAVPESLQAPSFSPTVYSVNKPVNVATYKLDPKRYLILLSIAVTGAAGMLQWLSTAPGSDTLAEYFGVSSFQFQFANFAFYVGAGTGVLISLYLLSLNTFGIRPLTLLAAGLILGGAFLRMMSFPESIVGFIFLCVGNFTSALSAGVLIIMPTNIAVVWFGTTEQTTATGLTLGGSGVGAVVGYILGAFMTTESDNVGLWTGLNAILLGVAIIAIALDVVYVKDEPDHFPSAAAESNHGERKKYSTWKAASANIRAHVHAYFVVMLIQDSLGVAIYFTIQTTLQTMMNDRGYGRDVQNAAGVTFQIFGLAGTIGFSFLVDRFNIIQIGSLVAWIISAILFVLLGLIIEGTIATNDWGVYGICAATGLLFSAIPPIALQLACNTVFPIPPALVTVSIFLCSQIATAILLIVTQFVGGVTAWYIMYTIMGIATALSISNMWAPLKRDLEQAKVRPERELLVPVGTLVVAPIADASPASTSPALVTSVPPSARRGKKAVRFKNPLVILHDSKRILV